MDKVLFSRLTRQTTNKSIFKNGSNHINYCSPFYNSRCVNNNIIVNKQRAFNSSSSDNSPGNTPNSINSSRQKSYNSRTYHTAQLGQQTTNNQNADIGHIFRQAGRGNVDNSSYNNNSQEIHPNCLDDLDETVGTETATRIRADLAENEQTASQTYSEKTTRERKYVGVVKFWSNYIPSNSPCEDRRVGLRLAVEKKNSRSAIKNASDEISYLFGIFDGHGGGFCADMMSRRIGDYFMVTQLSTEDIDNYLTLANTTGNFQVHNQTFVQKKVPYKAPTKTIRDPMLMERCLELLNVKPTDYKVIRSLWTRSLIEFSQDLRDGVIPRSQRENTKECLRLALKRLDADMAKEALKYAAPSSLHYSKDHAKVFKEVAKSGCVGSIAVVKQGIVHLGHAGDTRVVFGMKNSKTNEWKSVRATPDHICDNEDEIERINNAHPGEKVIYGDRVLGVLQPTRAFGDNRLKQSKEWIEKVFENDDKVKNPVYEGYETPPYVIGDPKMSRVALRSEHKFMLMATDGFWDKFEQIESKYKPKSDFCGNSFEYTDDDDLSPAEIKQIKENKKKHRAYIEQLVVEYVGEHLDFLDRLEHLDEDSRVLYKKKLGFENNMATEVIKKALMIDVYGESQKYTLAEMMTLRVWEV